MLRHHRVERRSGLRQILARRGIRRLHRRRRREVTRLEPQKVYLPLGIGGHVDHQLCREVGLRLLRESRRWVMPGPEYTGIATFYDVGTGQYFSLFASGSKAAILVCRSTSSVEAASRSCESPISRVGPAWQLRLSG